MDRAELFLFVRNYEKFKRDREGLIALVKTFTEKNVQTGSLKLERRTLPKLLKVNPIPIDLV